MNTSSWSEEAWRLALVLGGGLIAGLILGSVCGVTLLALAVYMLRHLYNVRRLLRWLDNPDATRMPVQFGVWGDVYSRIARQRSMHLRRERRLSALLEQFQRSAAALPDGMIALGPAGEIRWMNQAAQGLLDLHAPGDYGRRLTNLVRVPAFQRFMARGKFDRTLEITPPGPEPRKLLLRVVPYDEEQLLIIAQDITERYRVERLRRDFVANVSHELRTPLTVISGFVENMQADPDVCPEQWRRPLALINEQTTRMQQIVEDLLLLARLEGGERKLRQDAVDIPAMLEKLAEEARLLAARDVDVMLDCQSGWLLRGDTGLLRSAIGNLVVNAVHHTPPGGEIVLHWVDEPDASCVIVEDTGEGIAPEHIPRLTERFYRVDTGRSRERGGTGLGLAIVKHVLQVHDGRLEILSTPGEGSQFICRFPARLRVDPSRPLAPATGLADNQAQSTN